MKPALIAAPNFSSKLMPKSQKTLIIGPAWIGDMVMSQTLFKLLKQASPDTPIDVLSPAFSQQFLTRMPEINKTWVSPVGHGELGLKKRYALAKTLAQENYTQAIVLPNSFKSALIPLWAKIPLRTGWLGEARVGLLNDYRKLDKIAIPLMVQRFASLAFDRKHPLSDIALDALPMPQLHTDPALAQDCLTRLNLTADKPICILCPAAEYGPAKRWPAAYFAQIAKAQHAKGWQTWILGGPKDCAIATEIQAHCDNVCTDLTGKTQLTDAIDLMGVSQAVISNDSGLMHIAAALDKPLVVIYGSSSPAFTPPLTKRAKILSLNLPCSPCFKRECPLEHLDCLKKLNPDQVLSALEAMLKTA